MSVSFYKVTTGTNNFVSLIWNSNPNGAGIAGLVRSAFFVVVSAKTQLFDQVKINST